ncbi:MAG: tRNA (cytosine(32)/uridine(32)-2'-O)-methyltransferase TrmJ [Gammaproteobacteria bacterium]|nr:tRNA (cytosine(32)/uridine(32)-2'-O)-methyltransferase TrmJ [Gammaproteobacteria bacterium]
MSDTIGFPSVRIVLVETSHPGNIGAAARAMKNMGLSRLILVSPLDFPNEQAVWRAASASDVVESAFVVDTVAEAIADCQLVIGTSARDRRIPWPLLEPRECGEKVTSEAGAGAEVAILFGREARGLKNEELQQCHYHVNIPTAEAYSSLNLAMAVQVIAYEILLAGRSGKPEPTWDMDYASAEAVEHLFNHLERTLVEVGFHDPQNPRQLMTRLRRLLNRVRLDTMEVNILRGFLTAIEKRIGHK